jgi:serine phosphatase RsbU (regulator of sigma subunit)
VGEAEDELLLLDEASSVEHGEPGWKLLIVDDEPEMHGVTRMALSGLRFDGRGLHFLSAHSGAEACRMLAADPDIAVVLLDVVMETEDAGLQVVRYVRETLGNHALRIVLRTGQAGQAPERHVILEYDINDYKEKTELTAAKLTTSVVAALRAWQTINEVLRLNRDLAAQVAQRTEALQRSLEALEQGERAGRRMQFKLLPPRELEVGGFVFSHLLLPSEYLSGDFLDYLPQPDGRVLFYLADVAGHGVASAFVTVYLKRFITTQMNAGHRDTLLDDPARLLDLLNAELLRDSIGKHIALSVAVLDPQRRHLRYANAGAQPPPLLCLADGSTQRLAQRSSPVGLLEQARFESVDLPLASGFVLALASDGVLELPAEGDAEARLAWFASHLRADLEHADALAVVLGCSAETALPDDVALLMLRDRVPA